VIKWIFYFDIISYLIIILLALCDIYGGYGICNLYGVYYNKWIDYQAVALLIPALLLSICFVVGLFLSERKELLRAK